MLGKRAAMLLLGVVFLVACATTLWAQNHTDLKTFTAPDGAFSFRYWDQLIRCETGPEARVPDVCSGYVAPCDDLADTGKSQTSIVCFGYPRNKFTDTPAFEAATFSVEVVEPATAKSCLAGPQLAGPEGEGGLDVDKQGSTRIQGVSFAAFEFGHAHLNHRTSGRSERPA